MTCFNDKTYFRKKFNLLVGLAIIVFLVIVDISLSAHAEESMDLTEILKENLQNNKPENTALIAAIIAAIATIITPIVGWILNSRFENRELTKINSLVKQGELLKQLLELKQAYSEDLSVSQMDKMKDELNERLIFTHDNLVNNSIAVEIEKNINKEVNLETLPRSDIAFLLFKPNSTTGWLLSVLFYLFLFLIPGTVVLIFTVENPYFILNVIVYGLIMRTIHRTAIRIHSTRILKNHQYLAEFEKLKRSMPIAKRAY